jgi:hypothetical protein
LLQGFVSISPEWKTVSLTRLISATQKVRGTVFKEPTDDDQSEVRKENKESEERIMAEKEILKEFVEVELEESKGDSVMTLTSTNLKFNKATAQELGFPAYVKMYIDAPTRRVAIEPCAKTAKNAVTFSKDESKQTYAIVLKVPALLTAARKLADTNENSGSLSFNGTLYPKDKVIIFDLSKGKPTKARRRRKKTQGDPEAVTERSDEAKAIKVESEEN